MPSPDLEQLFGAYLHQDYDLEHGTIGAAITAFRDESTERELVATLAEIDDLLKTHQTDAALQQALVKLGFALYPPNEGITTTDWLRKTRAILAAQPE